MCSKEVSTKSGVVPPLVGDTSKVAPRAFLSYSRSSEGVAQGITQDLIACGVAEVWWDKNLIGAQPWWDTILRQIQQADLVVCLVEGSIRESLAVQREYQYALDLGKPLLPLLVSDDINISTLPVELSGKQYVDYRTSNTLRLDQLSEAIVSIPAALELPDPLPLPPDLPRTENEHLLDRVNSLEELSEEAQHALVSQLRELALSGDQEQKRFVIECLDTLQNRRELYARVSNGISSLKSELNHKPSNLRPLVIAALVMAVFAGAVFFVPQMFEQQTEVELTKPITDVGLGGNLPEVDVELPIPEQVGKAPIEELLETEIPVSAMSSKPAALEPAPAERDGAEELEAPQQAEEIASSKPSTTIESKDKPVSVVLEKEIEPVQAVPSSVADKSVLAQAAAYSWFPSFSVFEEQSFALCGYQRFTAEITSGNADSASTTITIRSRDRSIPGRTALGYRKSLHAGELTKLFPDCFVQLDLVVTSGVSRISVRTKGK